LAGVVAAGFAFGLAATLIARAVRPAARTTASVAAPARP
jgi:hypothetical protein